MQPLNLSLLQPTPAEKELAGMQGQLGCRTLLDKIVVWQKHQERELAVPGFEPGLPDSESGVLTTTLYRRTG